MALLPFFKPCGLDLGPSTLRKRFNFFDVGGYKLRSSRGLSGLKRFKSTGAATTAACAKRSSSKLGKKICLSIYIGVCQVADRFGGKRLVRNDLRWKWD